MGVYPTLEQEILLRGIKKRAIANKLGIADKTLSNKLTGKAMFTWPEACAIKDSFFPDMDKDALFAREQRTA